MRGLTLIILFVASTVVSASEITTKIHDIIVPTKSDSNYLILAESGDIFELDEQKVESIDAAYYSLKNNVAIKINLVDISLNKILGLRENVSEIELVSEDVSEEVSEELLFEENEYVPTPLDGYSFTVIPDMGTAKKLFRTMRTDTRGRSQCYNRAHVWAYNLNKRNVRSGKIWLFFNKRYIREYRYKWWFHVAPYIKVEGESEISVIDREFTRKPLPLTEWKNIFMKNNAACPTVKYYSDYRENFWDGSQYCYYIKSSMYYWMPKDIEALENGATEKKSWVKGELESAYKNAIRRWNGDL